MIVNKKLFDIDEKTEKKEPKTLGKRLKRNSEIINRINFQIPRDSSKGFPLLTIKQEYFNLNDLIVDDKIKQIIYEVSVENKLASKLYPHGLKPRRKLLFCGPPGTGKTLSAKIMSQLMGYPFVYVLFDSILSSYLGETATNLRKIFDFIQNGRYVVLFDEFDIIGKKRDDPHEHGEIKRVVNNFIQMIDNFDSESIIIAATNHQHLLDTAIWRRFQEILYFSLPDERSRNLLFIKYLRVFKHSEYLNISDFVKLTKGFSASDIAQICEDSLRRSLLLNNFGVNNEEIYFAISEQERRKRIINT
jgi:SpoVK/Ycf46/Vps4 family AAA+-type ATPase